MLCVELRAAAEAGATVLRTTQGCLLVTGPGVGARFVLNELPPLEVVHGSAFAEAVAERVATTVAEAGAPYSRYKRGSGDRSATQTAAEAPHYIGR